MTLIPDTIYPKSNWGGCQPSKDEKEIELMVATSKKVAEQKKEKADRYNSGKRKWSLVHWKSLEPMVEVLEFGAQKYSPDNWRKGLDKKEILESMMRHLTALMDGQDKDPESGISHMGHLMCNAMFYNYFDEKIPTP